MRLVACAVVLGLLAACGGGDDSQGGLSSGKCDPGTTKACACLEGGQGQKTCNPDGEGYAACNCTPPGQDVAQPEVIAGPETVSPGDTVTTPDVKVEVGACTGAAAQVSGGLVSDLGTLGFDRVTISMIHKRDVDPYEDGCIVEIGLDFARGDGCRFHVTAAERVSAAGQLAIQDLSLKADSQCPGFPDEKEGAYSLKGSLVLGDVNPGTLKVPDANAAQSCFHTTITVRVSGALHSDETGSDLALAASTLTISADVISSGSMTAHCPCAASCQGADCGDDGCGGSCGQCGCGAECESNRCVFHACDARDCGPDGCGGSCGSCTQFSGSVCSADGTCGCTRACEGRVCGDDSCGGSCGTCTAGKTCNQQGQCVTGPCQPVCQGKQCGPDGCNGSCGVCTGGKACNAQGQCVASGVDGCSALTTPGCAGCECEECVCGADDYCCSTKWDASCVNLCKQCGGGCGCAPACDGAVCGDDGCGGSCGNCTGGLVCKAGTCTEPGQGAMGDSCTTDEDCQADLQCLDLLMAGLTICSKTCTPFSTTECPEGWSCLPDLTGGSSMGVCVNFGGLPM
jgi:hypothetical protein